MGLVVAQKRDDYGGKKEFSTDIYKYFFFLQPYLLAVTEQRSGHHVLGDFGIIILAIFRLWCEVFGN